MWRLLLLLSLCCGCVGALFEENCRKSVPFVPGTFLSDGGHWENGTGQLPHDEGGVKTLVLEEKPDRNHRGPHRSTTMLAAPLNLPQNQGPVPRTSARAG